MHDDLKNALDILHNGGIILYPTDTVWGIGCDATNKDAIDKIYKLKQRTDSKSMLLLSDNENRILSYINEIPEMAYQLLDVADKPLTIIYPNAKNLPQNIVAEDNSIGIRITSDRFCQQLIQRFKKPIVSTSANISGEPSPKAFSHISRGIIDGVDYIVKHRQDDSANALPSSIIKINADNSFYIIRK